MSIIVIMLAINLLVVFSIIYVLVENEPNLWETELNLLFGLALFSFPLWYGVRLWKAGVSDSITAPEMADREISTREAKLSFHDYAKVILKLTFSNPIVLYLCLIVTSMGIGSVMNPDKINTLVIVFGVLILLTPLMGYVQVKRNYNTNKNLKEAILYKFDSNRIFVFGETFNSTLTMQSLYKVKELNDFLLLYTSKPVAIIISKNSFTSNEDLKAVKSYLINTKGIRKELKNYRA